MKNKTFLSLIFIFCALGAGAPMQANFIQTLSQWWLGANQRAFGIAAGAGILGISVFSIFKKLEKKEAIQISSSTSYQPEDDNSNLNLDMPWQQVPLRNSILRSTQKKTQIKRDVNLKSFLIYPTKKMNIYTLYANSLRNLDLKGISFLEKSAQVEQQRDQVLTDAQRLLDEEIL